MCKAVFKYKTQLFVISNTLTEYKGKLTNNSPPYCYKNIFIKKRIVKNNFYY